MLDTVKSLPHKRLAPKECFYKQYCAFLHTPSARPSDKYLNFPLNTVAITTVLMAMLG